MAKEKIDYSKLTLGSKKKVLKKSTSSTADKAVKAIHEEDVRTKRVTLDIPVPLHARIRKHTFDLGITMKKYFLELAERDLDAHE